MSWGWDTHRFINEHAVDYLPPEMAFFKTHQDFLTEHAPDPDKTKNRPGYWHYIDIDNYPEFFSGTLPTDMTKLIGLYDAKTVTDNGIVPWAIGYEIDSAQTLMSDGQWDMSWQALADLGHYVADSHQPLHLTANYNGQLTGQTGIHSRYETQMINPHLENFPLPEGTAKYWENVNDSVFQYIQTYFSGVTQIMAADSDATAADPSQDSAYYAIMWEQLDSLTVKAVDQAILDLASIWYTTWVNAGCPYPAGVNPTAVTSDGINLKIQKKSCLFFKPKLKIEYTLPENSLVKLGIYDNCGKMVHQLVNESQSSGQHSLKWDYKISPESPLHTGNYFIRLSANNDALAVKLNYSRY